MKYLFFKLFLVISVLYSCKKEKNIIIMKYLLFILLLFFNIYLLAQNNTTINWTDEQGRKQDQWIFYYPDGAVKEIHHYQNDKLDGWFSSFYEKLASGGYLQNEPYINPNNLHRYTIYNCLKEQIFYKNGLKHGVRIKLNPRGKLMLQCYYENDTLERKYSEYEEGNLIFFCYYEKGKIHGEQIFVDDYKYSSKAYMIIYYTYGRTDSSILFYETDEIKERTIYKNNQIIWEHTYDKIGNIMWAEYYDNDRVYKIEQYQRDFKKEQDIKNDKFFRKYYKDTLSLIWIKHYKEE